MKVNGRTLTSGTDYSVSYSNNINQGTGKVTVTGKGNYSGTLTKTFTIGGKPLSDGSMSLEYYTTRYAYDARTPAVTVTYGGTTLTQGTDYTVTYTDNRHVGTATVTATGTGSYSGSLTRTFSITPYPVENLYTYPVNGQFIYDGTAKTPRIAASGEGVIFVRQDESFTVTYENNIEIGTATYTIHGFGDFTGTASGTFEITDAQGQCGDNLLWWLDDGVLTISGSGAMWDYNYDTVPWYASGTKITKVNLPEGLTYIGIYAFYRIDATTVTIPDTVTSIGSNAFNGAGYLTDIVVPDSVTEMGGGVFSECTSLTNATIGTGIKSLPGSTFSYSGRTAEPFTVNLPEGMTSIGANAFWDSGLTSIQLPSTLQTIEKYAFFDTLITSIVIPEGVTKIGDSAFIANDNLTSVSLPSTLITIEEHAFGSCKNLASITLPEGLKNLGAGAFRGTKMTGMTLPVGITTIGALEPYPDVNKTQITDIWYPGTAAMWEKVEGHDSQTSVDHTVNIHLADEKCGENLTWLYEDGVLSIIGSGDMYDYASETTPWYSLRKSIHTVILPEGLTSIGDYAFNLCTALRTVEIPDQVTNIGYRGFRGTAIESITIPASVTRLELGAFASCTKLASVQFESGLQRIDSWAFNNCALTEVTIPDTVTIIEEYAFNLCKNLRSVTLPESITTLGTGVFNEGGLTDIYYTGNATQWNNISGVGNVPQDVTVHYVRPIQGMAVTLSKTNYTYNGNAKKPTITVMDASGATLVKDQDYTVVYRNNIYPGTASVTITGKGDYTGSITENYSIAKQGLANSRTSLYKTDYTYTGVAKKPTVTITSTTGEQLVLGTDYTVTYQNNKNAGTGTAIITGKGNYTGTVMKNFTIDRQSLGKNRVSVASTSYTYTGKVKRPAVEVKDYNENTLKAGTDYMVTYTDNVNAGTATVTVTGIANFKGTITKTFTIASQGLGISRIALSNTDYIYTGKEKKPEAEVKDYYGNILKLGTDYTVTYTNNVNAGTATATIQGIGNFTGTIKKTFTVSPQGLGASRSTLSNAEYVYTGKAKRPDAEVKDFYGNILTLGADYTVTYTNNVNAGTATVIIQGIGNFTGTIKKTFTIAPQGLGASRISLSQTIYTYTGKEHKPVVEVKDFYGNILTLDTDYTVTYTGNVRAGTATVTIQGIGNFTNTVIKKFTIK